MKLTPNRLKKLKLNLDFIRRLPAKDKKITLSSIFTLTRIFIAPFIVGAMITQRWGIAFVLFLYACLTDMIDGKIARLLGQQTFLGACLDPIADKILILSIFFTLAFVQSPLFSIPAWFVWLVLCKEIILVGGAFLLYLINGHIDVRPRLLGKLTTVAQMGFIIWLFACYFFEWLPIRTYSSMLGILLVLIFASLIQYIGVGLSFLSEGEEK